MPEATAPNPKSDAEKLDAAADQAIAACGGDASEAVKALIVANESYARVNYCPWEFSHAPLSGNCLGGLANLTV